LDGTIKIPELAQRLGVSEQTARRYVKSGELPSVFIGGAYRVSEADLEEYLRGARVQPGDLDPKVTALPSSKTDAERRENTQFLREELGNCHALLEELAETYKEAGDFDRLATLSNLVGFSSMGAEEFVRNEIGSAEDRASKRVYAAGARLEELLEDLQEYWEIARPTEVVDATVLDFAEHLRRKAAG